MSLLLFLKKPCFLNTCITVFRISTWFLALGNNYNKKLFWLTWFDCVDIDGMERILKTWMKVEKYVENARVYEPVEESDGG